MPRSLSLLLASFLAALAMLAAPPAQAAEPLTGRLVDGYSPGSPAASGMTVQLRVDDAGAPGSVVASTVTGDDGSFSLDPGDTTVDEYWIEVLPGTYQGGWIGSEWVQRDPAFAITHAAGSALGDIKAVPAFIRGTVVNSATRKPVRGVRVTARSQDRIAEVDGADLTDSDGVFRITGLTCEDDCFLKLNGSERGYEVGFRACNARVVATWGDACASPLGRIGRVFLDKS